MNAQKMYARYLRRDASIQGNRMWMGILLLALIGLIHLLDAPSSFGDATYKGLLYVALIIGSGVAATGIYLGRRWGWELGVLIAVCALVGYVISRTIGLPGLGVDRWLSPLGILSLIVEALFIALYVMLFSRSLSGGS